MNELAKTMETLEEILKGVKGVDAGAMTRPVQFMTLDWKSNEIELLKERIVAYTRKIQLSVQFITLYETCFRFLSDR